MSFGTTCRNSSLRSSRGCQSCSWIRWDNCLTLLALDLLFHMLHCVPAPAHIDVNFGLFVCWDAVSFPHFCSRQNIEHCRYSLCADVQGRDALHEDLHGHKFCSLSLVNLKERRSAWHRNGCADHILRSLAYLHGDRSAGHNELCYMEKWRRLSAEMHAHGEPNLERVIAPAN